MIGNIMTNNNNHKLRDLKVNMRGNFMTKNNNNHNNTTTLRDHIKQKNNYFLINRNMSQHNKLINLKISR